MKSTFALLTSLLAGAAQAGTVVWSGDFDYYGSSSDFNNWSWANQVGPYQSYIHGTSPITNYLDVSTAYKNPGVSGESKGLKLSIDQTSTWNSAFWRTELIPQTTANLGTGQMYYHFSVKRESTNPPLFNYEHQVVFFESHFTELKVGVGSDKTKLQWYVSGSPKLSFDFTPGVWYNFAYDINFSGSTVGLWASTGSDPLVRVYAQTSASTSTNSADWHLGLLAMNSGTAKEDWYFSGVYVESGTLTTALKSGGYGARTPSRFHNCNSRPHPAYFPPPRLPHHHPPRFHHSRRPTSATRPALASYSPLVRLVSFDSRTRRRPHSILDRKHASPRVHPPPSFSAPRLPMPLPDEPPLTDDEVRGIDEVIAKNFEPIKAYVQSTLGAVIDPATFLKLPLIQEHLQNLIDDYAVIYDLLPRNVFLARMNEMIAFRDVLCDLEDNAMKRGDLPPLFTLELETSEKGYPRLAIPRDFVETLIRDAGLTNPEVAAVIGCSLSSVERRLREWGIRRRDCTLSRSELTDLVTKLKNEAGLFHGERAICGMLHALGHYAPRDMVREVIRMVDPEGVQTRWRKAIVRRVYSVPFVNSLWHIDGHHKLIRWKIVIHGGIDGKSRLVVFLLASDNNRAETVGAAYAGATEKWGWPSRVRADWGGENVQVKEMMEEVRGTGRASFLAGPSTHNQRIERLWRDVFTWTVQPFYALFSSMEGANILDTTNELQLWALHLVFLPRINRALDVFCETWNNHRLSSQQNKTPRQLFMRGLIEARQLGFLLNPGTYPNPSLDDEHPDIATHLPSFTMYGAETRGAQRERRANDPHVTCDPPFQGFMSAEDVAWIVDQIETIDDEVDFYGTDRYLRVLELAALLAAR